MACVMRRKLEFEETSQRTQFEKILSLVRVKLHSVGLLLGRVLRMVVMVGVVEIVMMMVKMTSTESNGDNGYKE